MSVDEQNFKEAMSCFASGVTIVTTRTPESPYGLTVSSFCSLSLHPPLILVCLDKGASSHDRILEAGIFAVNILAADQKELSQRFATSKFTPAERFAGLDLHQAVTGAPILPGALAFLDCKLYTTYDGGDHTIFVGEVLKSDHQPGREPLLYFQRNYQTLDPAGK
ncbi:MAG: flavin reductase [Calditrichaeota bacterium]|nr:MAG: flavin reductase [Calditrichota bacterium]